MPARETEERLEWEREKREQERERRAQENAWRENVLANDRSFNDRIQKLELEIAVLKVKAAFVAAAIGIITSLLTTVAGQFLLKSLKLQ